MHSIELKFDVYVLVHRSTFNIDFGVQEIIGYLQDIQNFLYITTYRLKLIKVHFSIVKLHESTQIYHYYFNFFWSSYEIICIAFTFLLLRNMSVIYTLRLLTVYNL